MTTNDSQYPIALNTTNTLSQSDLAKPNLFGNLPMKKATIEQFNATISSGQTAPSEEIEPAFGEHIREAVGAVKRLLR
jgi:hypothetical protein